jgi:hypothetical protein
MLLSLQAEELFAYIIVKTAMATAKKIYISRRYFLRV